MIPVGRILEKEDQLFADGDFDAVERLLSYWIAEAKQTEDLIGAYHMYNEQMGLYRKIGKREEAYTAVERGLALIPRLHYEDTVSGATGYLNAATVYKTFGESEKALSFYKKTKVVYEALLEKTDSRLAGLYNNMALALLDLKQFSEAEALYRQAISIMQTVPNGELDEAISWLNLADLFCVRDGYEEAKESIGDCLDRAEQLLDTETIVQGNYAAFVYEKCAPIFGYYFRPDVKEHLEEKAKQIHERT